MVLQTFIDIGYIGVIVFLMMLYRVTKIVAASRSPHNRLYAKILILVFVFGITSSVPTLMSIEISTFFFLFVGFFTSRYGLPEPVHEQGEQHQHDERGAVGAQLMMRKR